MCWQEPHSAAICVQRVSLRSYLQHIVAVVPLWLCIFVSLACGVSCTVGSCQWLQLWLLTAGSPLLTCDEHLWNPLCAQLQLAECVHHGGSKASL